MSSELVSGEAGSGVPVRTIPGPIYSGDHVVYCIGVTVDLGRLHPAVINCIFQDTHNGKFFFDGIGIDPSFRHLDLIKVGSTNDIVRRISQFQKRGMWNGIIPLENRYTLLMIESCDCGRDVPSGRCKRLSNGDVLELYTCRREQLIQSRWDRYHAFGEWFAIPKTERFRPLIIDFDNFVEA